MNLVKYLKYNYEEKMNNNTLNGEMIINLLNVVYFNFRVDLFSRNEDFVDYCKTHLILNNKPLSDICTFSKTKQNYNLYNLN